MISAVRIQPQLSTVPTPCGVAPVASIALGGYPRGAVVVLLDEQDTALHSVDLLNLLAEHGYESISCDPTDAPAGSAHALVGALVGRLAERGWEVEQIGLLGVGSAAQLVLDAIAEAAYGAAVTVGLAESVSDPAPWRGIGAAAQTGVRTPWLGLWGADARTAVARVALADCAAGVADRSAVYTEVVCYPGVPADFYRDLGDSATHAAAFDAWQRCVEWLNLRVAPRPTNLARSWAASNGSAQ